ncbi:MAG: ribonuclease III domain-containing protein [Clostridia bacterium]|nr:ribonuclease III domain-containing protein [Clostridia bacterium]
MDDIIERKKDADRINQMSPLTWAYVGDAVYELFIRTHLTNTTDLKPNKLHIQAIKYVKAQAQSNILKRISEFLTDEEKDIVRRGRNVENHHVAKNASLEEYTLSTAFEALIGYLYLTRQDERLKEVLDFCII